MNKKLIDKKYIPFYFLYMALFLFVFLCVDFADGRENAYQGYTLIKSIVNGNFIEVYNNQDFSYGLSIYSIYAIWSIPVVLIEMIFGFSANILGGGVITLWYKLLLIAFVGFATYWMNRIVKEFYHINNSVSTIMFFLTSGFVFMDPFVITQCDIMGLSISLMGVYYLMKNNNKRFILSFSVAITMKYMALILFIPLLLFREKNVKKLIIDFLSAISLTVVSLLLVSLSDRGREFLLGNGYVSRDVNGVLIGNSVPYIGNIGIALFCVICIYAYLKKTEDEEYINTIPWLGAISWTVLLVFNHAQINWYILIFPYLLLILFNNKNKMGFGIFLQIVYTNMIIFLKTIETPWVFGGFQSFQFLLLKSIIPKETPDLLYRGLMRLSLEKFDQFQNIYMAISFVSIFAIIWLFRYKKENINIDNDFEKTDRLLLISAYIQLGILVAYFGLITLTQIHYLH